MALASMLINTLAKAQGAREGENVQINLEVALDAFTAATALLLDTMPGLKTPRDMRRTAEAFGKSLHGRLKVIRQFSEELGHTLLEELGQSKGGVYRQLDLAPATH